MKIFYVFLLIASSTSIQAMTFLKRCTTEKISKTALGKAIAFVDSSISIGPIWGYAIYKNYKDTKNILSLPDACPEVSQFVKDELKRHGFKDWNTVSIKNGHSFYTNRNPFCYAVTVENNNIKLALQHPHFYQHFSKNGKRVITIEHDSNTFLDATRAILGHEKSHLTSFDHLRITAAAFTIPLMVHSSLNKITNLNFLQIEQKLRSLMKIPYAFSKLLLSFYLIQSYRRHREWVADEAVPNDPRLLRSNANLYGAWHEKDLALTKIPSGSSSSMNLWDEAHKKYFSTHPAFPDRIKRFEKRIRSIK